MPPTQYPIPSPRRVPWPMWPAYFLAIATGRRRAAARPGAAHAWTRPQPGTGPGTSGCYGSPSRSSQRGNSRRRTATRSDRPCALPPDQRPAAALASVASGPFPLWSLDHTSTPTDRPAGRRRAASITDRPRRAPGIGHQDPPMERDRKDGQMTDQQRGPLGSCRGTDHFNVDLLDRQASTHYFYLLVGQTPPPVGERRGSHGRPQKYRQ